MRVNANELVARLEEASRRVVWQTSLEKSAALSGLYESLGDSTRPHGVAFHGLGVTKAKSGLVIEAYVSGRRAAGAKAAVAKMFGFSPGNVSIVPCSGLTPHALLNLGDRAAHVAIMAQGGYGTLGGFATDLTTPLLVAVSNNHVFANSNQASVGDQLNHADGALGQLLRFHPLAPQPGLNDLDAALGSIFEGNVPRAPRIRGSRPPAIGLRVHKTGGRTGRTTGTVIAVAATALVPYPGLGPINFRACMRIVGDSGPFSLPGDSGSLVLDSNNSVVGIIFAGDNDGTFSLANPSSTLTGRMSIAFPT